MRHIREAGFTLVELLVCIAVIGLLAALGVPRVNEAMMTSRQAQVQADLKLIHTALAQHFLDLGYYPRKLKELKDLGYLPGKTTFESPVSSHWYFYAVDDNTHKRAAHAFVLGAPPRDAGDPDHLYHARPLPQGKPPGEVANAWIHYSDYGLNLYAENDQGFPIDDDIPADLSDYRDSCKPASTTPCDLWTN